MSLIHLIVGDQAAQPLLKAVEQEEAIQGEVIILKDILHVGPLKTEGLTFSEGRSQFWNTVMSEGHTGTVVDDLERLMQVSSRLSNDEDLKIWFWMAPAPADVAAYFWLLHYLKKHQGRFHVVNINGLPFLDDNGKLFYPESIGHIPVKEIIKARKLARVTLPSEWETDGDEWSRLVEENAGIRVHEGGKRLLPHAIDHYDSLLLPFVSNSNQKSTKVINQAMTKHKIPTGDLFLIWRLRAMAEDGKIEMGKGELRLKDTKMDQDEAVTSPAE